MLSRDSLLFSWSANNGLYAAVGGLPHFTQAGTPNYIDEYGTSRAASAANVERYERNTINSASRRVLRLEKASTNLVIQSDALNTGWSASGTVTRTNAYATHAGVSFSRLTTIDSSTNIRRTVTLTGDGTKCFSQRIRSDGAATAFACGLFDNTAGVWRAQATVTVSSAGVVTAVAVNGSVVAVLSHGDGTYRVLLQATGCVAANQNDAYAYNYGGSTANVRLSRVQVEDAASPSSEIPTTTATVTRAADQHYYDYAAVPQGMMVYVRFVERGSSVTTGAGILSLSNAAMSGATLRLFRQTYYSIWHANGGGSIAQLAAIPAVGDTVELLGVVNADGSVAIYQSINGGTVSSATDSTTTPLASAWSDTRLWVNANGTTVPGLADFADIKVLKYADFATATAAGRMAEVQALDATIGRTFITFTDTTGLVTLSNEKPYPADRFSGLTPASMPVGDSANRMSDGRRTIFRTRSDYSVSLTMNAISSKRSSVTGIAMVDVANRLKYHLENGGTCIVSMGDYTGSYYATCGLKAGSKPSVTLTDKRALEFSFSAELTNLDATPTDFLARYAEQ